MNKSNVLDYVSLHMYGISCLQMKVYSWRFLISATVDNAGHDAAYTAIA